MISRLIEWSLKNRFLVIAATLLLAAWGTYAVRRVPIDAIPDLSENQVIVYADWEGRSPREVEDQVTYPLSAQFQGLSGIKSVRGTSMFGFSLITLLFDEGVDNQAARTRVLERLSYVSSVLPGGVTPRLGPDATGLGWVYQYYLKVDPAKQPNMDLGELRALQDYFLRYQIGAVSGVAEVAGIGGFARQYQVEVSSHKMRAYGISLQAVMDALTNANLNVGGKTLEENGMEFVVRGVGLVKSAQDLEKVVLGEQGGTPVTFKDIATIQVGGDYRRGILDVDGREAVGGTVVMRSGANAYRVIQDVKARIAEIAPSLPVGVTIEPFYDRSELIGRSIHTLTSTLLEAIILVTLMHVIFLFHFRSILIVTLPLPLSILAAFVLMREFSIPSHIMSLTGIAIAIGVLVDAAIVMTENVIRHCEIAEAEKGRALTNAERWETTLQASKSVGRPIFFAMAIIILAFVPIFALTGQEGKLFHPLAFTKSFAMVAATLLSVTLVPVLCTFWVRGPFHSEDKNRLMRVLLALYDPVLNWALRHRKSVLALAGVLLGLSCWIAFGLPRVVTETLEKNGFVKTAESSRGFGSEFMPTLEECSLLFMPVLVPTHSITDIKRIMAWQDRVLKDTPEVLSVAGKLGRFETATDPAPVEMIETTLMLKPAEQWRAGLTKEALIMELQEKLTKVPGYAPGFLQPIENRVLMLSTGIRAQLGVKVYGDNLDQIQKLAFQIEALVRTIPGASGVAASRAQGKPYLEFEVDRDALARMGVSTREALDWIETGIGGKIVTTTYKERERWPIQLRLARPDREDLDRLADIPVTLSNGRTVSLGQLVKIHRVEGPNEIASENGRLRVFVQANVQGRDLGGFVDEVKERIQKIVTLPRGVTIEYSGQYENQIRARQTLQLIMPVVLVIIFTILYITFHSAAQAAHVILAVPFALTGGVLLQAWLGYPFSVAVWVGYIALFGTAIQTGVVMVVYLEEAIDKRRAQRGAAFNREDLLDAIKAGARLRLRPKVMTVATTLAGLIPIFWSNRTGVEVMRPLAAPVVGGMISSLVHILVVTPVLAAWMHESALRKAGQPEEATPVPGLPEKS